MMQSAPLPSHVVHADTFLDSRLWRLWAKWPRSRGDRSYHPVLCHMVDVASVTRLMWTCALTPRQRAHIAIDLGVSEQDAEAWVAFWGGLHDLGKASPAFQTQLVGVSGRESDAELISRWLAEAGLSSTGAKWAPHGAISLILMEDILPDRFHCAASLVERVAAIVGAHHGLFFTPKQLEEINRPELVGDDSWVEVQVQLAELLAAALGIPPRAPQGQLTSGNAMALAGLISVADWIGSNAVDFHPAVTIAPVPTPPNFATYVKRAAQQAERALTRVAWDHIDLSSHPQNFAQLFPQNPIPRAVQQVAIEIAQHLTGARLVIVESPMGEGKTEAAMYLADSWSVQLGQRGIYFALPTQATSNQMFGRVEQFLAQRFRDKQFVNLHLAHGMAALSEQYETLRERAESLAAANLYDQPEHEVRPRTDNAERGAVIAGEWFAATKRALLSPYGVGTVDQALLAALQVKHGFVRFFGLGGKTIIVDEVHAYDTYTSTLLVRLLEWLGALGAPTVLLSATLPAKRRHELLKHYAKGAGWQTPVIDDQPYPRVTYISETNSGCAHVALTAKSRSLVLRWVDGALPTQDAFTFPLAENLISVLRDGGCAAVVCNTVRRAQQMYCALETAFARFPDRDRPELHLFHAQLLQQDRQKREQFVLRVFGPGKEGQQNPSRPHRAVLVATQVIEQSLDLDFDLVVSDLAPVDLLLQRAGRVHRHSENDAARPVQVSAPTLWVCQPDEHSDFTPDFDWADEYIYEGHILLRTWHALQRRTTDSWLEIAIPEDVEQLIEEVYDDLAPVPTDRDAAFAARWIRSANAARTKANDARQRAQLCSILPPWGEGVFTAFNQQLDEDNPEAHATIQAQTRDGDPRLPIVVLDAAAASPFHGSEQPTLDEARGFLSRSINLSHKGLVKRLLQERVPPAWERSPWLHHHRVIQLDAASQATFANGNRLYTITLDPVLGVTITSRGTSPQRKEA